MPCDLCGEGRFPRPHGRCKAKIRAEMAAARRSAMRHFVFDDVVTEIHHATPDASASAIRAFVYSSPYRNMDIWAALGAQRPSDRTWGGKEPPGWSESDDAALRAWMVDDDHD